MIRVRQVKVLITEEEKLLEKVSKKLKIKKNDIKTLEIKKKSIDARQKDIYYVYEVDVAVKNEKSILKKNLKDVSLAPIEKYQFPSPGKVELKTPPIIVGMGPAGLFCAYLLAEHGYRPIIIERGEKVEERVKTVEKFWQEGLLNVESNVQFGEGGAGTFSDGKLNTLVKDKAHRGKKAFEIFVKNGAPKEIMYVNKPHIGTDILRDVVKNMREEIIKNGGKIYYQTKLSDIKVEDNKIVEIEVNNKEKIPCKTLILAIGHSARDTFEMLYKKGLAISKKPFAVGLRISHPQEMINQDQYKENTQYLPNAEYKLTYQSKNKRGVYTFCMCPGGYVVNASSEEGLLAVNGMSNHKRDTNNANSAIIVTIKEEDLEDHPLAGIKFQRELEQMAYQLGHGKIPIQLYQDFKENKKSTSLGKVEAIFKGEYELTNLNQLFKKEITDSLIEGINYFGTKIKGFDRPDAILAGVESRTSSPVRIKREEDGVSNIQGIYPIGEGAGYAGGITTSAMDGIKTAELIAKKYKNLQ